MPWSLSALNTPQACGAPIPRRSVRSAFATQAARRGAGDAAEVAAEVALIGEAEAVRDLGEGHVLAQQDVGGDLDAALHEVVVRRDAARGAEHAQEVELAQIDQVG